MEKISNEYLSREIEQIHYSEWPLIVFSFFFVGKILKNLLGRRQSFRDTLYKEAFQRLQQCSKDE